MNKSQNFYEKDSLDPAQPRATGDFDPDNPFFQQLRASRRNNLLITGSFFILIPLIAAFALYQFKMLNQPVKSDTKSHPSLTYQSQSTSFTFDGSDSPLFGVEDLLDLKAVPIPEGGNLPISARWVKQAGFHLATGDRAFQEHDYGNALSHYNKALLIYPDLHEVHRYIGLIHLQKKRYNEAAEAFEVAVHFDPTSAGLVNNLGVAYLAMDDTENAKDNFAKSVTLAPEYTLAHYNLASLYYRLKDYEHAAIHFEIHNKLDATNLEASQMYANSLIQLKKWSEAVELLDEIARSTPDTAPVHFRLAQALSMVEQHDKAFVALQRGVDLVDSRKALSWLSRNDFDALRNKAEFKRIIDSLSRNQG